MHWCDQQAQAAANLDLDWGARRPDCALTELHRINTNGTRIKPLIDALVSPLGFQLAATLNSTNGDR